MSIESDQHQGYNNEVHYEQDTSRLNHSHNNRSIYSHPASTDSPLLPQQYKTEPSPHRLNMSSQPTTPKPTSATTSSPTIKTNEVPLEKYVVTPETASNETAYSPHTNTIRTTSHRKDSIVPNINEQCPSFGPTEYHHNIVSMDRHSIIDVRLHTKVDRGFFLAEDDWTCYRRNYFQVSGSFSLEGVGILYEGQEFPCLVKDNNHNGQLQEIHCFMLGVSARLSDCEKSIQLIQHTPKRDKGPQTTPTPKPIRPGGNIGFSAVGSSQSIVTFERLQFKTATANNGKRRAAQQYYVIIVELLAKLVNGNIITIATTKSSALVVRGRSPGHYAETDSGNNNGNGVVTTPRQHRAAAGGSGNNCIQLPQNTSAHQLPPYGRPTAYAGASPNLFQPTEYMPYDYHGVAYTNYGHMSPVPPPTATTTSQQQQQYPTTTSTTTTNNSTPIMSHQQQHYVTSGAGAGGPHDRTHSSSTATTTTTATNESYPHPQHQYDPHSVGVKEEQHRPSPYYWQRSNEQQHDEQQEHWSRIRMASNHSHGGGGSHDGNGHSPYMNHPQQEHHSYYAQQQQQYGHYAHHHQQQAPSSLPPLPQQQGDPHYGGNSGYHNYDWQPRPKMMNNSNYSYESDRRHEYNDRQHNSPSSTTTANNNNNNVPTSAAVTTAATTTATTTKATAIVK